MVLTIAEKIIFIVLAAAFASLAGLYFWRIYQLIKRGQPDLEPRFDNLSSRIGAAIWQTLTQERVFRDRPIVSFFHSFIFFGFSYYILANIFDLLEGMFGFEIISDTWYKAIYNFAGDILTGLILIGVVALWMRRMIAPKPFYFNKRTLLHRSLLQKIATDSAIVSGFIIFHVGMRLFGQGFKLLDLGYDPFQPFASITACLLQLNGFTESGIELGRHITWWGALGSIVIFVSYFARSKHIHLFMAPIKYVFERKTTTGALPPMELEAEQFGVSKLEELSWPRILDAYACIQCNRCQDACPASATGKSLSPAALEINKRMELNQLMGSPFELKPAFLNGQPSPRPLLEFAISEEAVWACTTCGACMQVCPVADEQMLDIIDIRRERVLMAGEFPKELQTAFSGMERHGNPWAISADKRLEWAEGLNVPTLANNPDPDVLYWVGCAAAFDPDAQKTAKAFVKLLQTANVNFSVLGKSERCTGDVARRAGNEYLYAEMADKNIDLLAKAKPKLVVATCPHCLNTLVNEYRQRGLELNVIHHTVYLEMLVNNKKLDALPSSDGQITYHDPCYLGRHNDIYDEPRQLIQQMGFDLLELERNKDKSFCCGAGGAQFWKEEEAGDERISDNRFREIQKRLDNAGTVAVGCPFCKSMLKSTPLAQDSQVEIKDIAELMLENLEKSKGKVGSSHYNQS